MKKFYWTNYWKLTQDPFSEEPLYYNQMGFDKLLVRYKPIEEMEEILSDIEKHRGQLMRRRFYIIGLRGMGKTTLFNYVLRRLLKAESRLLPVYVNNLHVKEPGDIVDPAEDPDKLRLNFCQRTTEILFDMVLDTSRGSLVGKEVLEFFEKARSSYFDNKSRGLLDQATSEALLITYLRKLREFFDVFVLLYDELDKIDDYDIVLRFLRGSQGLLERLSANGCIIFLSGVPDFALKLRGEYKGVSGKEIPIHQWTESDAQTLIKSRLEFAAYTGAFPFENDVIAEVCSKAEGKPRLIQEQARGALIWAAYRGRKKIGRNFITQLIWKTESVRQFHADIREREELGETTKLLNRVYNPDSDDPASYNILLKAYELSRIFILPPSKFRETYGVDMNIDKFERYAQLLKQYGLMHERVSEGKKYFVLDGNVRNLLDYVRGVLKESLEYLPQVIRMKTKEVEALEPDFNLQNEIWKVLVTSPQRRFSKTELAKEILKNPDVRKRALVYYKVASDKELLSKLKQGLFPVLRKLVKDNVVTKLLIGRSNVFQFSETPSEMDFARNLRLDKDVVENLQAALRNFKYGEYNEAIPVLRLAVENSLRNLAKYLDLKLPSRHKLDTLGPINTALYKAKTYDQGLKSMIDAFAIQANPIGHGAVKLEFSDVAKLLKEQAKIIIRMLYTIKKNRKRQTSQTEEV